MIVQSKLKLMIHDVPTYQIVSMLFSKYMGIYSGLDTIKLY